MLTFNTMNNMSKDNYNLLWKVHDLFKMHEFISYEGIKKELDAQNVNYNIDDLNYIINIITYEMGKVVRYDFWNQDSIYETLDERHEDSSYSSHFYSFEDDDKYNDKSFLLISDTHIGDENLISFELLHNVYEYAEKMGLRYIFHLGDLFEGVRKFHYDEKKLEKQLDDFIKYYPNINTIKTIALLGNHDKWLHGAVDDYDFNSKLPGMWDLRELNNYNSSFLFYPRNYFNIDFSDIPFHFSHKLYLNGLIRDKYINHLDQIDEEVHDLPCEHKVYMSGHLHTGFLYTNTDWYNTDHLYIGVPSTSLCNLNSSVAFLIKLKHNNNKLDNVEIVPIFADEKMHLYEKENYEFKINEKNKVLKKCFK